MKSYRLLLSGLILGAMPLGMLHSIPLLLWLSALLLALLCFFIIKQTPVVLSRWQRGLLYGVMLFAALLSTSGYSHWRLEQQLGDRLQQPVTKTFLVRIAALSDSIAMQNSNWRQEVETIHPTSGIPKKLLLAMPKQWDNGEQTPQPFAMQPGEQWQVTASLKPAHSLASVGAFDVEKWLLTRGIGATGVVLEAHRVAEAQPIIGWMDIQTSINGFRYHLRQHMLQLSREQPKDADAIGVLLGLLSGDRALILDTTTQRYQQTGISHLLAISGPHVVLAAMMLGWVCVKILNLFPRLYLYTDRRRWLLPVVFLR